MFIELDYQQLQDIDGGCGWCYVGAVAVITGGALMGGLPGAALAALGVVGVILS